MKARSFLLGLVATLIFLGFSGHDAEGTISGASGYVGGAAPSTSGFTPQTGFAFSGSTSSGGSMTITSTGSVFGTKPYSGQPLVWAPMDTDMNGSSLGRISGSSTWNNVANLSWNSGCGPTNAGGCAYGGATKGVGGSGTQAYSATAGVDLSEWSGWASQNGGNGYYINDLGAQLFVYRQEIHNGFGHLDQTAGNSYNGVGAYNAKDFRVYSLSGLTSGSDAYPDLYWPTHNQRYAVEACPGSSCAPGIGTGPAQYINSSTVGGVDVNGCLSCQQNIDGMTTGTGMYNRWEDTEFYLQANSNASATASYPPSSQFWYIGVGQNGNAPVENWPIINYQNGTTGVNWMLVDTSTLQSNGHGTMLRVYAMQFLVDGTSGCPGACDSNLPLNAYVNYHAVYVDDCWCHIVVQDSSTYTSATAREIQIPSSWSTGSITMTLRSGAFSSLSGKYLFVVDSAGTAHLIGNFTWILKAMPLYNAANDDYFEQREAA